MTLILTLKPVETFREAFFIYCIIASSQFFPVQILLYFRCMTLLLFRTRKQFVNKNETRFFPMGNWGNWMGNFVTEDCDIDKCVG